MIFETVTWKQTNFAEHTERSVLKRRTSIFYWSSTYSEQNFLSCYNIDVIQGNFFSTRRKKIYLNFKITIYMKIWGVSEFWPILLKDLLTGLLLQGLSTYFNLKFYFVHLQKIKKLGICYKNLNFLYTMAHKLFNQFYHYFFIVPYLHKASRMTTIMHLICQQIYQLT